MLSIWRSGHCFWHSYLRIKPIRNKARRKNKDKRTERLAEPPDKERYAP